MIRGRGKRGWAAIGDNKRKIREDMRGQAMIVIGEQTKKF